MREESTKEAIKRGQSGGKVDERKTGVWGNKTKQDERKSEGGKERSDEDE